MVPASTVLIPLTGKNYEVTLSELLRTAGYHVIEVGDNDCFDDYYDIISSSLTGTSTVIIDIENMSCISAIIRAAESSVRKPKIVLLTSLLTWCGEGFLKIITDPDSDFCSRIPLHCARKSYDLENALWNAALDSRPGDGSTYFVGTGLLYGGTGWDFENSLRRLWRSGNNSFSGRCVDQELSLSKVGGDHSITNSSLQIHCDDFFNTVLHLVDASCCYLSPSYFPLVDGGPECAQRSQGPNNINMHDNHLDRCQNIAEREQLSWDPKCALLSSKLKFVNSSASLPKRRCRNFLTMWKEFTESHGLVPFNMMIVGGPQCGQTETAKAVSKMLDLQYVDIADTLKWVLESTLSRVASERASGVLSNREEPGRVLMDLVSAKIMEGSRKGSAIVTEVGLRSFMYTESFIQTLPSALQRKCVALRLGGCPKCQMKGYALDIWSTGHSFPAPVALISNAQDFMEIFSSPLPHTDSLPANTDDCVAVSIRPILTLVEFQSDKKGTLQRITTKFTDGKGTKEQLIALKALETRVESYTSRLQDVPDGIEFTDLGVRSPLVNLRSHEVVVDIMRLSNCRAFRICAEEGSSVEDVAQLIADHFILPASQNEREIHYVDNRCGDEATVPALAASNRDLVESCPQGIIDDAECQDLISKINEGLVDLKVHESESLVTNCNELLQYLEVNVNSFVAKGLICIERARPVDPIQCFVEALEAQGRDNRDHARATALAEFGRILKGTGSRT